MEIKDCGECKELSSKCFDIGCKLQKGDNSARTPGSIAAGSSVVADYVAFCKHCGGWVAVADASTPEMKKVHQKDVGRWAAEGHRVELVEHTVGDPMPEQCKNWPAWWDCESVEEDSDS